MDTFTRYAPQAARYALGFVFFVFGLNAFLHFLPQPPLPGPAGEFIGALVASGFIMPTVKLIEIGAGLLLLSNRFVPLALTLLAPILVVITLFHALLAPAGVVLPLVLVSLSLYLAYVHRAAFAPLLRARSEPESAPNSTTRLATA